MIHLPSGISTRCYHYDKLWSERTIFPILGTHLTGNSALKTVLSIPDPGPFLDTLCGQLRHVFFHTILILQFFVMTRLLFNVSKWSTLEHQGCPTCFPGLTCWEYAGIRTPIGQLTEYPVYTQNRIFPQLIREHLAWEHTRIWFAMSISNIIIFAEKEIFIWM